MHRLEHRILAYIKEHQLVQPGDKLLIACSGGVDSMALLAFFQQFQRYFQIEIAVAHVDHMLRGEASAQDRVFVERYCVEHQIPVYSSAIPVAAIHEQEGGNSQAICRRERYQFFNQVMEDIEFTKLVTAHHADDQLESMLMALTKASSLNGLKGILPIRSFESYVVIRPLLMVTKAEIGEYLHKKTLMFREDASNEKDSYTRNRFRHHIVPLLKQENASVAQHAVQMSQQLVEDDFLLMQLAQAQFLRLFEKIDENCYKVCVSKLQKEPLALQRRLILILLSYLYNDSNVIQSYALCTTILALFDTSEGSRSVDLPENYIARRQYDEVVFEQKRRPFEFEKNLFPLNEWVTFEATRMYIGELALCDDALLRKYQPYYFEAATVDFPLQLRAPKQGDRMALKGMQQKKKLSRIFIDDKIPFAKRANWPLLVDTNDEPLALLALRVSNKFSKVQSANHDYVLIVESNQRF